MLMNEEAFSMLACPLPPEQRVPSCSATYGHRKETDRQKRKDSVCVGDRENGML